MKFQVFTALNKHKQHYAVMK